MKYIRTKDGIYEVEEWFKPLENDMVYIPKEGLNKILKQADTIEELCDVYVVEDNYDFAIFNNIKLARQTKGTCYGAIWTDKGLIYVAKVNEKGVMELL